MAPLPFMVERYAAPGQTMPVYAPKRFFSSRMAQSTASPRGSSGAATRSLHCGRADLAVHGVGGDDAHGAQDGIGIPAVAADGIFPGGTVAGAGPQHLARGHAVGSHRGDLGLRELPAHPLAQQLAKAAALAVDNRDLHSRPPASYCLQTTTKKFPAQVAGSVNLW